MTSAPPITDRVEPITDGRKLPYREDLKGYCRHCLKDTKSLHKCPDCGRYVQCPAGSARECALELSRGKRRIRLQFKSELITAYEEKDAKKISEIKKKIKAEILAYISPGFPEERTIDNGPSLPLARMQG